MLKLTSGPKYWNRVIPGCMCQDPKFDWQLVLQFPSTCQVNWVILGISRMCITFYLCMLIYFRLVGDVLLCTGFLSYSGPFNQEFRTQLQVNWKKEMHSRNIPFNHDLNLITMLVDNATVRYLHLKCSFYTCSQITLCKYYSIDRKFTI